MAAQEGNGKYSKRLRIGIKVEGANFLLLNGDALPKFRSGAVADLMIDENLIEDPAARIKFSQDKALEILEKGSSVLLGLSPQMVEDPKADGLIQSFERKGLLTKYWFVEVRLEQPLYLRIRGDQEARLEKCDCFIPALKESATSINHAFTIVSEAFERKRQSHTGNVFERVFGFTGNRWQSLDDLRRSSLVKASKT